MDIPGPVQSPELKEKLGLKVYFQQLKALVSAFALHLQPAGQKGEDVKHSPGPQDKWVYLRVLKNPCGWGHSKSLPGPAPQSHWWEKKASGITSLSVPPRLRRSPLPKATRMHPTLAPTHTRSQTNRSLLGKTGPDVLVTSLARS